MQEELLSQIHPGMPVCDSTGHEVGTILFVYRQLRMPQLVDDQAPSEQRLEIKTHGFLGLGERIHIGASDVCAVSSGAVLLCKPLAELRAAEHPHPSSQPGPTG